jgi:hypothetical protein
VVHTTQGASTIESLGAFFANPANQVSSHAGADDKVNTVGVYVGRDYKSWTQADFNPVAVSIELCAWAEWDRAEWFNHPNMLENCASWLREEADHFGIPLVQLTAAQAQGSGRGVCDHRLLGSRGGGHSDCGDGFPLAEVIAMAGGAPEPPAVEEEEEEKDDMFPPCTFTMADNQQQSFYVDSDGRLVHCWQLPGRPWVKEILDGHWDPRSGLAHDMAPSGNDQVWGMLASGGGAQVYWSGTRWVLQPLP